MAVKTSDYILNFEDFTTEGKEINAYKKTALRIDGLNAEDVQDLSFDVKDGVLTIRDGAKYITVTNYSSLKYIKTDYNKVGKKEYYNLTDIIAGGLVDNLNDVTTYNAKKLTMGGTNYNDTIHADLSGYAPTGKNIAKNKGLTINGGNGHDKIYGTAYNDAIKGGSGTNTIYLNSTDFGNDTITLTKGEKLNINLNGATLVTNPYSRNKNNLLVTTDQGTLTLVNYYAKNTGATVLIDGHDLSKEALLGEVNASNYFEVPTAKIKTKYTGSALADEVNASGLTVATGKNNKGVSISTGYGDDIITGSNFNDTITGGVGKNTFNYTVGQGNDVINLTKGEEFILKLTGVLDDDVNNLKFTYSGKDLRIYTDKNSTAEYLTLKNFASKDVTGANGSVILNINGTDYDLRTNSKDGEHWLKITPDKTNFTGGWQNDYIDASASEELLNKKGKHVNMVFNGGAGADKIIGSNYADVLKAGTGTGDILEGGQGSDSLYASTTKGSETTFVFNTGDGADTVYSGKGSDTLKFNSIKLENITMMQGTGKNNKDLIIKYTNNDTVTVKNYYTVNKKGIITGINSSNTIKNIVTTEGTFVLSDYTDKFKFGWGNGIVDSQHSSITMSSSSIQDTIMFNTTGSISSLKFVKEGDNLRIWYNKDNTLDLSSYGANNKVYTYEGKEIYKENSTIAYCSSVIINDYFTASAQTIDKIEFKYGNNPATEFSILNDSDANKQWGYYNDVDLDSKNLDEVFGTYDAEAKEYTGTKYADYITTQRGTGEGSTVHSGDGNDRIYTWGRSDTVYAENGNDSITGKSNCILLDGGAGNDTIYVSYATGTNPQGYVKVVGGTGNDTITGCDSKKQIYEFNKGDGVDIVTSKSNLDVLKFNDVELSELQFSQNGNDIVINYGESDVITLKDTFKDLVKIAVEDKNGKTTTALGELGIISDSGEFEGTDNSETIYGSNGADTITSKKGDDHIYAKGGDDILVFNNGDGNDTVYQATCENYNALKFADADLSDLDFAQSDNDLIISYGINDTVTIKDFFSENDFNEGNTFTKWIDKNGDTYDIKTINRHNINSNETTVNGTIFNDYITVNSSNTDIDGKEGSNTYLISEVGTYNITSTSDKDTIKFSGIELGDLTFGVLGDDVTIKNDGETLNIAVKNYLVNMPTIYVQGQNGEPEQLITKLASAGMIYSDEETITGNAGVADKIFGGDSSNIIDGKGGNDTINGGKGNDIYQFKKNYGNATIINGTEQDETDTIQFMDSNLDDLDYELSGDDLVIKYNNGADSVTVKDYNKSSNTVKNLIVRNEDNTSDENYSISDIRHVIRASSTDIVGTDKNDKIYGTDGYDVLHTGVGNDILIGGDGADIYDITKLGSGIADSLHTTIVMGTDGAQDIIRFSDIDFDGNFNNLKFAKEGDNLRIWYNKDYTLDLSSYSANNKVYTYEGKEIYKENTTAYCSSVIVKDYFTATSQTIDTIQIAKWGGFSSYSILNNSNARNTTGYYNDVDLDISDFDKVLGTYDAEAKEYTGTKYADYITTQRGSGEGHTVYAGGGNDYIYTWGRTDTVYGEAGNDYIWGNKNCILLDGGAGNDEIGVKSASGNNPQGYVQIVGGTGNDKITSGYGVVHIYTNSDTDGKDMTVGTVDTIDIQYNTNDGNMIYAQSETNNIKGGKGNDNYFAYIDQTTNITENGGDEDSLTILDTSHNNLHIAFDINKNGENIKIGSMWILDDTNYAKWQDDMSDSTIKGVNIKNSNISAIETITANDGYYLTSDQLNALQSSVAGWLDTNSYDDVSAVLESADKDDLISYIATQTNWQTDPITA